MVEVEKTLKKWQYWRMLDDEAKEALIKLVESLLEEAGKAYGKPTRAYGYPKREKESIIPEIPEHAHLGSSMVVLPQEVCSRTGETEFDPEAFVKYLNSKTIEHQLRDEEG